MFPDNYNFMQIVNIQMRHKYGFMFLLREFVWNMSSVWSTLSESDFTGEGWKKAGPAEQLAEQISGKHDKFQPQG